jgi:hypothetical protein
VCFPLDGSLRVLVVAPVMTDLDAAGGGDDYAKAPKGNLDVTGQYFLWTSNAGGGRLDAFIVKVPSQQLTGTVGGGGTPGDVVAPSVSISAPGGGATVSGTVALTAAAVDNVAVAGVQFRLDGANLGGEITAPPYTVGWNTAAAANGSHVLLAVARDAAGNTATSAGVAVTVANAAGTPTAITQPIVWTNPVNVMVNGSSLQKTSGCDGCTDAGAVSMQRIKPRGGYVEFTASEKPTLRYIGLSRSGTGTSPGMDFALRLQSGYAEVREANAYRADVPFAPGDVFRILVKQNGVVRYFKNGTCFYKSAVSATFPLAVRASLANTGATIANAILYKGP